MTTQLDQLVSIIRDMRALMGKAEEAGLKEVSDKLGDTFADATALFSQVDDDAPALRMAQTGPDVLYVAVQREGGFDRVGMEIASGIEVDGTDVFFNYRDAMIFAAAKEHEKKRPHDVLPCIVGSSDLARRLFLNPELQMRLSVTEGGAS